MEIIAVNMPLEEKDERLLQIEELINAKRKMLHEKQKKLRFISKQNHFLDAVKNDYNQYYQYISQQKKDQTMALELLNKYINDLSISGELSKHNIEDAKFEQSRILREVKTIKKGLDDIISDTNEISSHFNKNTI